VAQVSTLTGAVQVPQQVLSAPAQRRAAAVTAAATTARVLQPADIANAEVIVRSSGNVRYVGMTNTDAQGRFSLAGVPAGGVSVQVRRNGVLIARGAAVFPGGQLNQAQLLNIELVSAETSPKSGAAAR
jgi:hypothetical protein